MEGLSIKSKLLIGISSIFLILGNRKSLIDEWNVSNSKMEIGIKLVISSIDFEMRLYDLDSELNNVDYNVEALRASNYEDRLFYIVGHSGNGDNCYFNKVRDLRLGEYIYIIINEDKFIYRVEDIYYIVKDGYMEIFGEEVNSIYLITCDIYNNYRQLVIKGVLVN